MAKLTRNSFKRKIIVIGLMVFASIALISTGFAAWIISTSAQKEGSGNISVGIVTDGSITISEIKLEQTSFKFEPLESDETGRVRNDGANYENLSVKISGSVTNAQYLNTLSVKLDLTEAPGVKAAAEAGYIILPDCASNEVVIKNSSEVEGNAFDFEYTITFKWGEKFNFMNPGLYYDEDSTGMAVADDQLAVQLNAFRKLMYNQGDDYDGESDLGNMLFKVIVIGTIN